MAKTRSKIITDITEEFDLHTPEKQVAVTGYLLDDRKQFEELSGEEIDKLAGIYEDTPGHFNFALQAYKEEQENLRNGRLAHSNNGIEPTNGDTGAKSISHMKDQDTGEVVEITSEFRDEALQVHGQIEGAFWQLATALARIKSERLYLALGFDSFKNYCKETLPFGVRNAYHYALVGERIGLKLLESDSSAKLTSQHLERAGLTKLHLLTTKAEDQLNQLIEEGKINIDGEDISAEELADRRVSELKEMLKNSNEKAQKAELLEEQKKNVEMERDSLAEEKQELAEWKREHQERADNQDEIDAIITRAFNLKKQVLDEISKLDPEQMFEIATEAQQQKLVLFLDAWKRSSTAHNNKHIELIEFISEQQIDFPDELV